MKKSLLCLFLVAGLYAGAQNYSLGLLGTSNQGVSIGTGAAITGTGAFAVEAWVKTPLVLTNDMYIVQQREPGPVGFDGEYFLQVNQNGQVRWLTYGAGDGFDITTTAFINDGNWHHVAATREADGSAKIYIDGELNQQSIAAPSAPMAALSVAVGYDFRDVTNFFTGDIEEVRIWNTARTQSQIKEFAFKAPANNAAGLVAYYKCDENGGATLVNSGTNTPGIDGTIVNGATWTASQVVRNFNAINLDGVDDYISTSNSGISGLTAFTLEGWIYPTVAAAGIGFFGQNNAIEFGFDGPTSIGAYMGNAVPTTLTWDWVAAGVPFALNTWHHVALTGDGVNTKLYIDGILRQTLASVPTPDYGVSGFGFSIGANVWDDPTPPGQFFTGSFDEVRVWNVARTAGEISSSLLTELNPASQIGLINYYTFNQGTAAGTNTFLPNVIDLTGNNKGVLNGLALTGATSNYVAQNPGFASLPVNWLSFTASKQGERVVLNWATSLEEETKDFVIEHSTDAINWRSIGTELARNTAAANYYQFTHSMPDKTLNFYRLKQRDENGRFAYSKTVSVRFAGVSKPLIYSNPISNGILSIRMEQAGQVQLFTQQGQLVMNKQLGAGLQQMNISHLAKGVYMVKFNDLTASIIVQ